jgi:cellulose synthase/poly-beta-1,6-N-acetylglucosamine synthase-like glycosyltransferase/tetratricopeptide (TPR) repeat protein
MKHPRFRQALIVITVVTCVVYLFYRVCFTLNVTTPYAVVVSLALFAAELFMGVLMFLFLLQVWRLDEPQEQPILPDRTVDVLVPTYNEDVEILRTTLLACVQMDHPHKTYLCDDGGTDARINDPEKGPAARKRQELLQALCAEVGAIYMTRPRNEHAKAGNMNSVMKQTDGEFVVILDADHVPDRNFITRLIGYFRDDRLAYVQTPHAFYNFDSFQARYDPVRSTYWEEGQLFYDVIQPARNSWNAAIFAGSAAMFRRQALVEIGGFAVETITEDLHTGLRLHARGWKSLAISERLVAGQAAPDVTTFHSQRLRWGEGNLSIFAYDNPLTTRGLTLAQRLCYLGSMLHWANGPFLLLIYLTPLLMLFSGVPPVAQFEWLFASLIVLYIGLSNFSFYYVSNGHASFWNSQVYCMTNAWTSTRGLLRAIFRRRFQKFVVTSKRGRQSKSVLAYIWPHAAFFLASVLALAWGWYRPISCVSDDYYKPILASVWAVFHICVALVILRRSLWPEDRRFTFRHVVALPAALTSAEGGAEQYAVTVDLNDTGVGLLAYQPLAVGSQRLVTIRGGCSPVRCLAKVRRCEEMDARLRAGVRGVRAYRCGLSFIDPSPAQVDGLNQIGWHYAVPLRYALFDRHRIRRPWGPPPLRLPVLIFQGGAAEPTYYTVTEDLSPAGLTAMVDANVPVGTELRFRIPTPGEEVSGTARVVEVQPKTLAARTYWQCRLAFAEIEEAGRATLDVLLGARNARQLRPLLRPHHEPRRVPVLRPAAVGLLLLVVLLPVAFALFRLNYRDEYFLDQVAAAPLPLSPEQDYRLQDLVRRSISKGGYPSNDRLVLLESALLHADKRSEAVQVTRVLAKRDLDNLSLQLAYAQALDDMGEPADGLREYEKLLKRIAKGDFPADRRISVVLAAARTAVHAERPEQAIPWYREVLASEPVDEVALRNELAGVLLGANHAKEAVALLADRPQDWDGSVLLTKARLLVGDYVAAEKDARQLLERRPKNVDAGLLLLDAVARQGKLVAARELGDALIEDHPEPPAVRIRVGETALAVARYPAALLLFQGLLQDGASEPVVQRGFIDAAAGIQTIERIDPAMVEQVARAAEGGWLAKDAVYLGRLAWVCQRLRKYDQAVSLLRHVLDLESQSQEARQRYVGVLLVAGRADDAVLYLQGLESTLEVRSMLIDVYLHEKNYDAIEKIAKANLHFNPLSLSARLSLIEVALAKKDRARAQELLAEVRRFPPESPELRGRLANVYLWSGDHAAALAEYRSLLEQAPTRKEWWRGFVDAAATAPELTDVDARLILPVAEQSAKDGEDVVFLSRLAWVLHRRKETALCQKLLDRALALKPAEPAARKELAGVLGAAGRYKEALALYEGLPPDAGDRQRLASLYEAAGDFSGAAAQYRLILEKHPKDLQALDHLGQVLTWKKDFAAAATVYEQLVQDDPSYPGWLVHVAELKLWSGDAAGALTAYTRVLEKEPRQSKLWPGFIDAAGLVPRLDAAQAKLARYVGREVLDQQGKDPQFLSRLAWVLVKAGATADALAVLKQADALHPTDPAMRKELAGVFSVVGRPRRAIELFQGLDLTFADRVRLVQFYNADHDFESAEAECRKLLTTKPGDRKVELLLADILAWEGKYPESAALLNRLRQADPDSKELARKLALVDFWGKNYTAALEQFASLLEGDPDQPDLLGDFVAAAAAAPSLDNRYRKMLVGLADKTLADPPEDTQFLSRLAQSLRTLKEPGKAANLLRHAVKIDPGSRPLKLQLAQALYDAGRYNEAKRYFTALLPTEDGGQEP